MTNRRRPMVSTTLKVWSDARAAIFARSRFCRRRLENLQYRFECGSESECFGGRGDRRGTLLTLWIWILVKARRMLVEAYRERVDWCRRWRGEALQCRQQQYPFVRHAPALRNLWRYEESTRNRISNRADLGVRFSAVLQSSRMPCRGSQTISAARCEC